VHNNSLGSYSLEKIIESDYKRLLLLRRFSVGRFILPVLLWEMVSSFQGESCGLCGMHHSHYLGSLRRGMPGGLADLASCAGFVAVGIPLSWQRSFVKSTVSLWGSGMMWSFYVFIP